MSFLNLLGTESHSSTANYTTTQESGFSNVSGPAVAIQGTGNNIKLSDQGAIAAAEQIAQTSLHSVQAAQQQASGTVATAIQAVQSANQSQIQSVMKDVMVAMIVGIIVWGARGVFMKK